MRKITLFLTTLLLVTKAMATVDIANTYYTTVTTETSGEFALYDVTGKTFVAEGGWTAAGTSDTPYYWTVAYNSEKKAYTLARTDGKYLKIGYYDGQYVYTDGESGAITYWTFTTNGTKTYTVYSKNGHHADSDGGTNLMANYYLIGANAGTESSSAHEYALISKADYANYQMSLDAFVQKASALSAGVFALYDVTEKKFIGVNSDQYWRSSVFEDTPTYYTLVESEGKYTIQTAVGYMYTKEDHPGVWMNGDDNAWRAGWFNTWTFENTDQSNTYYIKNDRPDNDKYNIVRYFGDGGYGWTAAVNTEGAHKIALITPQNCTLLAHNNRTANPLYPYKFRETSAITSGTYALYDIEAGKFLGCNSDPFHRFFEYSDVPVYCNLAEGTDTYTGQYTIKYDDYFMTKYPTAEDIDRGGESDERIKWLTADEITAGAKKGDESIIALTGANYWKLNSDATFENSYTLQAGSDDLFYGLNPGTVQCLTMTASGGVHHVVFVKQAEYDAAAKAEDVTMTSARYATFFNATDETYLLPLAYKAIALKLDNEGNIVEEEISSIPANTAVMLTYRNGNIHNYGDTESHTYPLYKSMESAAAIEGNLLQGTATATEITHDGDGTHYYYTLQNGSKGVGLYYADATSDNPGTGQASFTNAAKKAYLVLTKNAGGAQIKSYIFGEGAEYEDFGATAIESVGAAKVADDAIYNLAGQKVGADYKGIVIKNGKKYIVK